MASDSDDLEQELLRNLSLRRELGARAAQAKNRSSSRSDASPSSNIARAETASGNGSLDSLRRELKLRHERDSADLATLRLELKRRRTTDHRPAVQSDAGVQPEPHQIRHVEKERQRPKRSWKALALAGIACLLVSILVAVWLVYA